MTRTRRASTLLAGTLGAGLLAAPAYAAANPTHQQAPAVAPAASAVVGHTYVNGNTAGTNTLVAFDRHADGSLSTLPGSPFRIGGAGLGTGLGSQGALQASPDGRYLLAADAGSNQVSVLRLDRRGAPHLVGTPVGSGGVEPVSIAVSRRGLVYVANTGSTTIAGGSDYTGFRLSRHGRLRLIAGSTVTVPDGSGLGDVLFNATGDRLVGTRDTTSLVDSFTVGRHGRLTPAPGSPYPAQAPGPIGAQFRPTDPSELYVTNAHAGAGLGTVSAFHVSRDGRVSPIGTSPYPDQQTAPCWVEISHDGRYLFAVNTASATLSRYTIGVDGGLTLLGSTAFTNGTGAVDARLSPDGRTLSVTGGRGHVLSTFAVTGGTLTELPTSPVALPADGSPTGLVVL